MTEPTTQAGPPDWTDAEAWVIGCFAVNDGDVESLREAFSRVRADALREAAERVRAEQHYDETGELDPHGRFVLHRDVLAILRPEPAP